MYSKYLKGDSKSTVTHIEVSPIELIDSISDIETIHIRATFKVDKTSEDPEYIRVTVFNDNTVTAEKSAFSNGPFYEVKMDNRSLTNLCNMAMKDLMAVQTSENGMTANILR